MSTISACPVCDNTKFEVILELEDTPVFCNVLHPSQAEALAAPTGDIRLGACSRCSHIVNLAFDENKVVYSPDYENSLHFSPIFQDYATALAERLVTDYELRGRQVVELGSGKGDFLAMLAWAGATESVGFDPSYAGAVDHYDGPGSVRVVQRPYQAAGSDLRPALVACRHVLEHLTDPGLLLAGLDQWRDTSPLVYLEVPNADYMLEHNAVWDVIYEHLSYFTHASLKWLCERHGLSPILLESSFGDQYLTAHARLGTHPMATARTPTDPTAFGKSFAELRDRWSVRLVAKRRSGDRTALWGAGSKGVSFVSVVEGASEAIDFAVDLNPRKSGQYLPGSGIEVVGADDTRLRDVSLVLVANARYETEIRANFRARGIEAELEVI